MKKHLTTLSLIALCAALLGGCAKQETSVPTSDADSSAVFSAVKSTASTQDHIQSTSSSAQSSKSSQRSTAGTASSSAPMEESSTVDADAIPAEITEYVKTLDNGDFVFVDYTFDEEREFIVSVTNFNEPWRMTIGALTETDDYKSFAADYANAEAFGRFTDKPEDFLDQDGEPMPLYKGTITDDFDNDGIDESFVLTAIAKIPDGAEEKRWYEREYLFFVDENGAVLIDDYFDAKVKAVLDYDCCKQLIVTSSGWSGNDSRSAIWGIKDGKAVKLYGGRLDLTKTDCFLYSTGPQWIGDLAVYDTANDEYLAIQGKELSTDTVRAMDKNGTLKEVHSAVLVGGKYYIINTNGVYTYENGEFVKSDKKVRASATPGSSGKALKELRDVDYDKAVSSMKMII